MSTSVSEEATRRRHIFVFGGIFAAVCVVLGAGYALFIRTDYAVLANELLPADAAAIVAELDKRGVAYQIDDGGATISVPAGKADATRVAIAGSDAVARGQIGFELFNKSDMGLTNFAQKINYQRALQGELVRTITAMEGVESARVHLGLPERSLFRGERTEPSAAVTVTMKQGRIPDAGRVAGIQRLVAAAVPELSESKVAVLDGQGRVISATAIAENTNELDERQSIQAYYAARARNALEPILGAGKFTIRALMLSAGTSDSNARDVGIVAGRGNRDFPIRLIVVTPSVIAPEDQSIARDAIARVIEASPARGDAIEFATGPISVVPSVSTHAPAAATPPLQQLEQVAAPAVARPNSMNWIWIAVVALLGLVGVLILLRRRASLSPEEHEAFATKLRRQLASVEVVDAPR